MTYHVLSTKNDFGGVLPSLVGQSHVVVCPGCQAGLTLLWGCGCCLGSVLKRVNGEVVLTKKKDCGLCGLWTTAAPYQFSTVGNAYTVQKIIFGRSAT